MTNDSEINGPGRPAELVDAKRINVYLDTDSLRMATKLGDGNLSLGIRLALEKSKPPTAESVIEQIGLRHIYSNARLFLDDLQELIDALVDGKQDKVLERLGLSDPDVIRGLRQRESYEIAASNHGFHCYKLWDDEYVVTSWDEIKKYLDTVGGKWDNDGVYHIHTEKFRTYSGAELDEAIENFLTNEDGFWRVKDTPEEASKDACIRNSIPPVVLEPTTYLLVSDALAAELEQQGEIVSKELIGEYRVWGCLDQISRPRHLANVRVLQTIAKSREARYRLLGTAKGSDHMP